MSTCKKTLTDPPQLLMDSIPSSSDQTALRSDFGIYKKVVNEKNALNSIENNRRALNFERTYISPNVCKDVDVGIIGGKLKLPRNLKLGALTLKTQPL